jgi:hypothetical protein
MSSDKDHRNVASHVLKTAHKVVTTERGNQHGGAEDSFQMIASLWQTYLQNTNNQKDNPTVVFITSYDVAQMMTLLKIARAVHGNPTNEDNYIDASGYQSLAAAIAGVPTPESKLDDLSLKTLAQSLAPKAEIVHKHTEIQGQK